MHDKNQSVEVAFMKDSSKSGEKKLYEPIKNHLQTILRSYYVEKGHPPPTRPFQYEDNPYLEITAKRRISETLKREFSNETFYILSAEDKIPDIMGFVRKTPSSPKELITVEVKDKTIKLMDIFQARLYQEVFKSTLGFLISSEDITEERVRFVTSKNGEFIRGKVIILKYNGDSYGKAFFEINPRLMNALPESIKKYFELSKRI
jgi:hypothetical protein